MTKKATTKDEMFLVKLYELAMQAGEFDAPIDRYVIGQAIGQNDKGIDTIVRHLAQTNFLKKAEGNDVYLTPHGLALVKRLLER